MPQQQRFDARAGTEAAQDVIVKVTGGLVLFALGFWVADMLFGRVSAEEEEEGDEHIEEERPHETDVLPPEAVTVEDARDLALNYFGLPTGTTLEEIYHELTGPDLSYVRAIYEGSLYRDGSTYWVDVTYPRTTLTSYDVVVVRSSAGPIDEDTFAAQVVTVIGRVTVHHGGTVTERMKPANWMLPTEGEATPPAPPAQDFFRLGDVNMDGTVNIVDAMLLAQYLEGITDLAPFQVMLADVNQDGIVSQEDVDMIAQYTVGKATIPAIWINELGIVMHEQG